MKKILLLITSVFLLSCFSYSVSAQEKKEVQLKATAMAKDRGANANIKMARPTKDVKMAEPEKSRGYCCPTFVNHTGYYVDMYIDGNYYGTLYPYGTYEVCVFPGYTKIYCETTGGSLYWKSDGDCNTSFFYHLNY
ncbi:MAG: hypothetical protein ABI723_19090 [Bacteroidia bacterium]